MADPVYKFDDLAPSLNELSGEIVDCAFQVDKELGPGFLETNYEDALVYELKNKGLVELKAVEKIHPVHQAQIYAYLKATQIELGLLINFNVPLIKNGIGRYVLRNSESLRLKKDK